MLFAISCRRSSAIRARTAFSLVEVVLAVGIFAVGIVAVLGLFAPVAQSIRANGEAEAAAGAVDALLSRLRTEPVATVAGYLQMPDEFQRDETRSGDDPAADGRVFYVSLARDKVGQRDDPVWGGSDRDKYFELTLIRNEDLSPAANDEFSAWLAFNVRVRWPAFLPVANGGAVQVGGDSSARPALFFAGSVRR